MKVAEYRVLIDAIHWSLNGVSAAVGDKEKAQAVGLLRRSVAELTAAECPRATAYDRQRAADWLASAARRLAECEAFAV